MASTAKRVTFWDGNAGKAVESVSIPWLPHSGQDLPCRGYVLASYGSLTAGDEIIVAVRLIFRTAPSTWHPKQMFPRKTMSLMINGQEKNHEHT